MISRLDIHEPLYFSVVILEDLKLFFWLHVVFCLGAMVGCHGHHHIYSEQAMLGLLGGPTLSSCHKGSWTEILIPISGFPVGAELT